VYSSIAFSATSVSGIRQHGTKSPLRTPQKQAIPCTDNDTHFCPLIQSFYPLVVSLASFLGPGIDANYTAVIPLTRVHIQVVLIARIILGGITYIFRLLYEHAFVGLLYDPLYVPECSTTLMATQPLYLLLANTRSRPQFLRSFMILGLSWSMCFMQHADAVPRRENSVRISLPIVIT
jgi:hypothetical protein